MIQKMSCTLICAMVYTKGTLIGSAMSCLKGQTELLRACGRTGSLPSYNM